MIKKIYMLIRKDFSEFKNHCPLIVSMLHKTESFSLANAEELKNTASLDSAVSKRYHSSIINLLLHKLKKLFTPNTEQEKKSR